MNRLVFITLLILWLPSAHSQTSETLRKDTVEQLNARIDSLKQQILRLERLLQSDTAGVDQEADIDQLFLNLTRETLTTSPQEQRSRHKRVDALLNAIAEHPGHLRFNGSATATLQGNPFGSDPFSVGVGSFDILAHTSFGDHTLLFFDWEAIGGNGPSERRATLTSLNGDAGSTQDEDGLDRLHVLEAWGEFSLLKGDFTVTAGKIDLTNYFDTNAVANDETSQFISNAFVNSAAFAVPGNSPGIRLKTTVFDRFFVQLGLASADNSGSDILERLFKIGSIAVKLFPQSSWEANLRGYFYQHPSADNGRGYGLSYDETVAGVFNVFGRYTRNSDSLADWLEITSSWSGGLRIAGRMAGFKFTLGAAYGATQPTPQESTSEKQSEIYLRHQLNKWVYVSSHLQLVWDARGTSEKFSTVGFRTHFNF